MKLSELSESAQHWIGIAAGSAAAGLWSLHDAFQGEARLGLAILSGACVSLCLVILTKSVREHKAGP